MMCMCVCVHYSSFEYESPHVSCVALNALHTLYLGVQQSDIIVRIHIFIFFRLFSHVVVSMIFFCYLLNYIS